MKLFAGGGPARYEEIVKRGDVSGWEYDNDYNKRNMR